MVGLQLTKYGGENSKVNKLFICTQLNPQLISGIFREQDKEWQQQQGIIFKGKKTSQKWAAIYRAQCSG